MIMVDITYSYRFFFFFSIMFIIGYSYYRIFRGVCQGLTLLSTLTVSKNSYDQTIVNF